MFSGSGEQPQVASVERLISTVRRGERDRSEPGEPQAQTVHQVQEQLVVARLQRHVPLVSPLLHSLLPLWGGSVAEWLACWTRAQKGPGSNRSRDAVLGKLFTPVVPLFTKQQNW